MPVLRRALPRLSALVLGVVVTLVACDDTPATATSTLDQETFVIAYTDLRLSALGTPSGEITAAERIRILTKHEVTEDQLLEFAETHGADPEAMKEIWSAVETRLRAAAGEDSTEVGGVAR